MAKSTAIVKKLPSMIEKQESLLGRLERILQKQIIIAEKQENFRNTKVAKSFRCTVCWDRSLCTDYQ